MSTQESDVIGASLGITSEQNKNDVVREEATQREFQDTDSYNSETPLVEDTSVLHVETEIEVNDDAQGSAYEYENSMFVPKEQYQEAADSSQLLLAEHAVEEKSSVTNTPKPTHGTLNMQQYYVDEEITYVDTVNIAPIRVIGSGWEFGSVCSINLHSATGSGILYRGPGEDRLLSRIFNSVRQISDLSSKSADKSIGNCSLVTTDGVEVQISEVSKPRNARNLLILSLSMTLLHVSVFGLRNLQSSLNSEAGLGLFSLAAIFGAFMIGSLASPFIVKRFPPKTCLFWSTMGHIPFIVANYHASFFTIVPSAMVMGFCNSILWNAICTYITESGISESSFTRKSLTSVLSRYFGTFFLILQLATVIGNLISSVVLMDSRVDNQLLPQDTPLLGVRDSMNISVNATDYLYLPEISLLTGENSSTSMCGALHCDLDSDGTDNKPGVDDINKLFLIGTYCSCAVIAMVVIRCLLEHLPSYTPRRSTLTEILDGVREVFGLVVDGKFIFIVLLCMYTVFSNGFVIADVLRSFITCPLGVQMVGYSMICFGICGSFSSYVFGKLTKCIGRVPVFLTAAVLNLASLAVMATWNPDSDQTWFLMALLGAWGLADGIWQSQINSLISSVFEDRYEAAFSCCRVLQGVAGLGFFFASSALCMTYKMIFVASTCVLATSLYIVMEILIRRDVSRQEGLTIYVKP